MDAVRYTYPNYQWHEAYVVVSSHFFIFHTSFHHWCIDGFSRAAINLRLGRPGANLKGRKFTDFVFRSEQNRAEELLQQELLGAHAFHTHLVDSYSSKLLWKKQVFVFHSTMETDLNRKWPVFVKIELNAGLHAVGSVMWISSSTWWSSFFWAQALATEMLWGFAQKSFRRNGRLSRAWRNSCGKFKWLKGQDVKKMIPIWVLKTQMIAADGQSVVQTTEQSPCSSTWHLKLGLLQIETKRQTSNSPKFQKKLFSQF